MCVCVCASAHGNECRNVTDLVDKNNQIDTKSVRLCVCACMYTCVCVGGTYNGTSYNKLYNDIDEEGEERTSCASMLREAHSRRLK